MNQASSEAVAVESEELQQEQEESNEPQGLMEQARADVPHETEENEEPISHLAEDDSEEYERPDWFPEEHWDPDGPNIEGLVEALNQKDKSYSELRKLVSQGKHKAPKDDYDVSFTEPLGLAADNELLNTFKGWSKSNGVSQAAFEELVGKVAEMGTIEQEQESVNIAEERRLLGENGDAIIKSNIQWVDSMRSKGMLSDAEVQEFDVLGGTAAGQRVLQKIRAWTGENVQIPTRTAMDSTKESEMDFKSRMREMMADPRYGTDSAYQRKVESEFEKFYSRDGGS